MKYLLIERTENNETFMWEYDDEDQAIENIKYMRMKETAPYRTPSTIKLFKGEEIDISTIEGYSLEELNNKEERE